MVSVLGVSMEIIPFNSKKIIKESDMDYKEAGVDVEAGYQAVKLMREHVKSTFDNHVLGDIGSFGGFYQINEEDVLVAGTDGVGTKLKYAFITNQHDTIGIDCVAMCVNDIVCQGAKPLIFLDYIALSKLEPEKVAQIVKGVACGCRQAGCALIGGETAEMPGFYGKDEYDIAGFSVGIVKKDKIINGKTIEEGDVVIGLSSSGLHSNGYSLVRKIFGEDKKTLSKFDEMLNKDAAGTILTPTRIYVKSILNVIEKFEIKGIANITGGGFIENIPRILPNGLAAEIDIHSYDMPIVFQAIKQVSGLSDEKLYNTFNMGIGMVLVVKKEIAVAVKEYLNGLGEKAYQIGKIVEGNGVII